MNRGEKNVLRQRVGSNIVYSENSEKFRLLDSKIIEECMEERVAEVKGKALSKG